MAVAGPSSQDAAAEAPTDATQSGPVTPALSSEDTAKQHTEETKDTNVRPSPLLSATGGRPLI